MEIKASLLRIVSQGHNPAHGRTERAQRKSLYEVNDV